MADELNVQSSANSTVIVGNNFAGFLCTLFLDNVVKFAAICFWFLESGRGATSVMPHFKMLCGVLMDTTLVKPSFPGCLSTTLPNGQTCGGALSSFSITKSPILISSFSVEKAYSCLHFFQNS